MLSLDEGFEGFAMPKERIYPQYIVPTVCLRGYNWMHFAHRP